MKTSQYPEKCQELDIGTLMASNAAGVPGLRKRKNARLGISRVPFHEPIGSRREAFYEQKLLLGLAWYCSEAPLTNDDGSQCWRFVWKPPDDTGAYYSHYASSWARTPYRSSKRVRK